MRRITLFLVLLAWDSRVFGCDCRTSGPPEAEALESAAVFVGELVDSSHVERPLEGHADIVHLRNRLRFRVLDMIKPPGGSTAEIEVISGLGGGDCGLLARKGSFLLIYAFRSEGGELETNICTRSAPVLCATEDLRRLGRRKPSYLKEAMAHEDMESLPCVAKPKDLRQPKE